MSKLIFATIFFVATSNYLLAERLELKNSSQQVMFLIKTTGNRSSLTSGNISLNCSNKAGNRSYLNKDNKIVFRASNKAAHTTIYSYPDNKQLFRIDKKANKLTITSHQNLNLSLKINSTGAELKDTKDQQTIGTATYNALSKNIKCYSATKNLINTYKWSSANYSGLLWSLEAIPTEIRMIIINELLN